MNPSELKDQNNLVGKDNEISLGDILEILFIRKKFILVLAVFGYLAGVITSNFLQPIYTSEVIMISQLESQSSSSSGLGALASMAGLNIGGDASNKEGVSALATLKSRTFLTEFIKNNNIKPELFPELWSIEKEDWIEDVPSDISAVSILKKMITYKKKESGIITYQIDSNYPQLSEYLANNIITSINNYVRKQAVEEAEKSIVFLKKELSSTNLAGIQKTIYSQIEAHTQRKTLANARDQYAYKVIDKAVESLSPSWPNKLQVSLLGLVAGIILGFSFSLYSGLFLKES